MRFSTRQVLWASTFVVLVFAAIAYARMPSAREREYLRCERNLSASLDYAIDQLVSADQAYSIKELPKQYNPKAEHRFGAFAMDVQRLQVDGVAQNVLIQATIGRSTGKEAATRRILYPWQSIESHVKTTPPFEFNVDSDATPSELSVAHNLITAYTSTLSKKKDPENKAYWFMAWNCDGDWTTFSDKVPAGKYFARVDLYVHEAETDFKFDKLEKANCRSS